MKTLKEQLNEGIKPNLIEYKPNYNVQSDVYNILEALAYRYELKGKKFDHLRGIPGQIPGSDRYYYGGNAQA